MTKQSLYKTANITVNIYMIIYIAAHLQILVWDIARLSRYTTVDQTSAYNDMQNKYTSGTIRI